MKVDNAIILAAGTASRFAPLSLEKPKALIEVRGEILIERQIRQLREAGIQEIVIVVGYRKEDFAYLTHKYGVKLVENPDYLTRNNHSSIYAVKDDLKNSYICSSDNYFLTNPFERDVEGSYYSAVFAPGKTEEWCITEKDGWIQSVTVGGADAWVMLGHVFWSEDFSRTFLSILEEVYHRPETAGKLWETIYLEHLDRLPMRIRKYPPNTIFEFDTLDELRQFDPTYVTDTRSAILKEIAARLSCAEADIVDVRAYKTNDNAAAGIRFRAGGKRYMYPYQTGKLEEIL